MRYVPLDPDVYEQVQLDAAKSLDASATAYEHAKRSWREGVKFMVVQFSAPTEDPLDPALRWTDSTPEVLVEIGKYFTTKDIAILEKIFRDWHEVSDKDADAIAGKALPVSGA